MVFPRPILIEISNGFGPGHLNSSLFSAHHLLDLRATRRRQHCTGCRGHSGRTTGHTSSLVPKAQFSGRVRPRVAVEHFLIDDCPRSTPQR